MGTKGRKPRAERGVSNVRLYRYAISPSCDEGCIGFVLVLPGRGLVLQIGKKEYIDLGFEKIAQFTKTTGAWEVDLIKDKDKVVSSGYKSGRITFTVNDMRYCCNAITLRERIQRTFPEYVQHLPQTLSSLTA